MKTKIIKIGNSRGIRLPKSILLQIGVENELNLEVDKDKIILKPIPHRRDGWRQSFLIMSANSDDKLLDAEADASLSAWDENEWIWES